MKRVFFLILLCCAFCGPAWAAEEPWAEASALFQAGDFAAGRQVLIRSLGQGDLSSESRARVLATYANFHEKDAGDFAQALRTYRQVLATDLKADHPLKLEAISNIKRIEALDAKFAAENRLLQEVRIYTEDREEMAGRVADLRRLVEERSDYHRLADAYFYIGNFILAMDLPHPTLRARWEAYGFLSRALEIRPGLAYHLPVEHQKEAAFRSAAHLAIKWSAWGGLGGILLLTMVLFFASRPWGWLRARHLLVLIGMALLWATGLYAAAAFLGSGVDVSTDIVPVYSSAAVGSPGSRDVLQSLFFYGLAGVFGAFALGVSTARFRLRWSAAMLNAVTGVLLFSCLTALFYLAHCAPLADYDISGGGSLPYLSGNFRFVGYQTMTPYVLTNPKAYPDLEVSNIEEPGFRRWVMEHAVREEGDH